MAAFNSFGTPRGKEKICVFKNVVVATIATIKTASVHLKLREVLKVENDSSGTGAVSAARISSKIEACLCCSSLAFNFNEKALGLLVGVKPAMAGNTPCKPANAPRDSNVWSLANDVACPKLLSLGRIASTHDGKSLVGNTSSFVMGVGVEDEGGVPSDSQSGISV